MRLGLVGMSADYDLRAGRQWIEVEVLQIVQDIDARARQINDDVFRKGLAPRLGIHVAAHGVNRSGVLELAEDGRIANVASMNDRVAATERRDRFGPKQTVRVGDQA